MKERIQMNLNDPFIYAGANELDDKSILNFYIQSNEYEKILSKKNIFVIGQRGSGKSMILKYNTLSLQLMQSKNKIPDIIGIYVPCNRPYFRKQEYMLLESTYEKAIVSEHFLVLSIAKQLINTLIAHQDVLLTKNDMTEIADELHFLFDIECTANNCLTQMRRYLTKKFKEMQELLLTHPEKLKINALSFGTLIFPIIEMINNCENLQNKHITFLIDDAQQLNQMQMKTLNTWVSYRDNSLLSFKIAITGKEEYLFHTETENSIMENHDFLEILLEESMFGSKADFNQFAKDVIRKRLELMQFKITDPDKYFASDKDIDKELQKIKQNYISGQYPESKKFQPEQRRKNASKIHRAIYFREISSKHKANKPKKIYTGFDTIIGISTGVIRNLLIMCSEMYGCDTEHFERKSKSRPPQIRTSTQYEAILDLSKKKWMDLKTIDRRVTHCSKEDAERLHLFFENFGNMLLEKILNPESTEKRILSFYIIDIQTNKSFAEEIDKLFSIAKQDGYLYTRIGPDKSGGKTVWYTPNRLLWPHLGLDPLGENGRFSLGATTIQSMFTTKIPIKKFQDGGLFNVT